MLKTGNFCSIGCLIVGDFTAPLGGDLLEGVWPTAPIYLTNLLSGLYVAAGFTCLIPHWAADFHHAKLLLTESAILVTMHRFILSW